MRGIQYWVTSASTGDSEKLLLAARAMALEAQRDLEHFLGIATRVEVVAPEAAAPLVPLPAEGSGRETLRGHGIALQLDHDPARSEAARAGLVRQLYEHVRRTRPAASETERQADVARRLAMLDIARHRMLDLLDGTLVRLTTTVEARPEGLVGPTLFEPKKFEAASNYGEYVCNPLSRFAIVDGEAQPLRAYASSDRAHASWGHALTLLHESDHAQGPMLDSSGLTTRNLIHDAVTDPEVNTVRDVDDVMRAHPDYVERRNYALDAEGFIRMAEGEWVTIPADDRAYLYGDVPLIPALPHDPSPGAGPVKPTFDYDFAKEPPPPADTSYKVPLDQIPEQLTVDGATPDDDDPYA